MKRRLRGNILKVFKILNGIDNVDLKHFFEYLRSTLRGHNVVNPPCQARHAPTERSVYTVSGEEPYYLCRWTGGARANFFSGLSAGFGGLPSFVYSYFVVDSSFCSFF